MAKNFNIRIHIAFLKTTIKIIKMINEIILESPKINCVQYKIPTNKFIGYGILPITFGTKLIQATL